MVEVTLASGGRSRFVYDAEERETIRSVVRGPNESGVGVRKIYDAAGRMVRLEKLEGVEIDILTQGSSTRSVFVSAASVLGDKTFVYDAADRLIEETDFNGETTRYEYDAGGQRTTVVDPLTNRTEFSYDPAGNRTNWVDALGRITTHEYDALGRLTRTTFPDGTFSETVYDDRGERVAEIDQDGQARQFEYDTIGRLTAVEMLAVSDPENSFQSAHPRYEYEYDIYGNRRVIRDPKGRETRFTYDEHHRPLTRRLPLGQVESNAYDAVGQLIRRTDFNGQVMTFSYDFFSQVQEKNLYEAGSLVPAETIAFTYNEQGSRTRIVESRGTTEFMYDGEDRVIEVRSPEGTIQYEYDPVTGLKTRSYTDN